MKEDTKRVVVTLVCLFVSFIVVFTVLASVMGVVHISMVGYIILVVMETISIGLMLTNTEE